MNKSLLVNLIVLILFSLFCGVYIDSFKVAGAVLIFILIGASLLVSLYNMIYSNICLMAGYSRYNFITNLIFVMSFFIFTVTAVYLCHQQELLAIGFALSFLISSIIKTLVNKMFSTKAMEL